MDYGLSTCVCLGMPVQDALVLLSDHGVEGVEYATLNLMASSTNRELSTAYSRERDAWRLREEHIPTRAISELASSLGIAPLQVHCPDFDLGEADPRRRSLAVEKTSEMLGVCSGLGAPCLVVHLGASGEGVAPADVEGAKARARKSLLELLGPASDLGIRIALENRWQNAFGSRAKELVEMAESTDPDTVCACLDTGHCQRRGVPPDVMLEEVGSHLGATHVHDALGPREDHLPPFSGEIDWEAFCRSLRRIGYARPLVGEIQGSYDPESRINTILLSKEGMGRLVALLSSLRRG